jgi:hypothetical protein
LMPSGGNQSHPTAKCDKSDFSTAGFVAQFGAIVGNLRGVWNFKSPGANADRAAALTRFR